MQMILESIKFLECLHGTRRDSSSSILLSCNWTRAKTMITDNKIQTTLNLNRESTEQRTHCALERQNDCEQMWYCIYLNLVPAKVV